MWARVGSLTGANAELAPWLALRAEGIGSLEDVEAGVPLRCALRGPLGLPLGPYPLCFRRRPQEGGFLEQTQAGLLAPWQHERTLVADGATAVVTDALGWRLRGIGARPRSDAVVAAVVRALFEHRHRRLRATA